MYRKNEKYEELITAIYQPEGQDLINSKGLEWTSKNSDLDNDRLFETILCTFNLKKIINFIEDYCLSFEVHCKKEEFSSKRITLIIHLKYSRIHLFLSSEIGWSLISGNICFDSIFYALPENYIHLCSLIKNVLQEEEELNSLLSACKQKAIKAAKIKEVTYKSIAALVKSVLKTDYSWELDIYSDTNPRLVINKNSSKPFVIDIDEANYVKQITELPTKLHGEC